MIAVSSSVTRTKSFHLVPVSKMFEIHQCGSKLEIKSNSPLGGPNSTASIALSAIFCLWIGSLMPSTLLTKWRLLTANRGSILPVILCFLNKLTYCGSWTLWMSHSQVISSVQLWTSDLSQASHNSFTEMCMSSLKWKARCRFSYPPSYFNSSRRN